MDPIIESDQPKEGVFVMICKRVLILTLLCAGAAQTAWAANWDPAHLQKHYDGLKKILDVATHRNKGLNNKNMQLKEMLNKRYKNLNATVTSITTEFETCTSKSRLELQLNLTTDELLAIFKGLSDLVCNKTLTLALRYNNFTYLPAAIFVRFKNVKSIDISFCQLLTNLEPGIFDNLNPNFTHLHLNYNPNLRLTDNVMSSFYNTEKKYEKLELVNLPKACKDSDIEKAIKKAHPNIILQCF